MAAPARREREKAEFREDVLEAARKIVFEGGFDALTMRKIAEAIEYSPGTIYLYFESRDAIAHELCYRGFEELLRAMAPVAGIADPRERLAAFGRAYVAFGLDQPQTYRLIFMEDPKFSNAVFEHEAEDGSPGAQALGLLIAAFEELKALGRIPAAANTAALADVLWAAVHGIVSLKLTCRDYPETPTDELTATMTAALLDGLVPEA